MSLTLECFLRITTETLEERDEELRARECVRVLSALWRSFSRGLFLCFALVPNSTRSPLLSLSPLSLSLSPTYASFLSPFSVSLPRSAKSQSPKVPKSQSLQIQKPKAKSQKRKPRLCPPQPRKKVVSPNDVMPPPPPPRVSLFVSFLLREAKKQRRRKFRFSSLDSSGKKKRIGESSRIRPPLFLSCARSLFLSLSPHVNGFQERESSSFCLTSLIVTLLEF